MSGECFEGHVVGEIVSVALSKGKFVYGVKISEPIEYKDIVIQLNCIKICPKEKE